MRLLRSREEVRGGETVSVDRLGELARRWYGDRLDPRWRPRPREASQRVLDEVGLTRPFWRLP